MKWCVAMIVWGVVLLLMFPVLWQAAWVFDHHGLLTPLSKDDRVVGGDIPIFLMLALATVASFLGGAYLLIAGVVFICEPDLRPDWIGANQGKEREG